MHFEELPPFVKRIDPPGSLQRSVANIVLHAIDSGWTPRTPLRTHVVMCGFPRAGSTLLSLMLRSAYQNAKGFARERHAVRVAYLLNRNHTLLLSKRPDDVFYVDRIREVYRGRRASVKFLLTLRDPRAILTSMHAARKGEYYVSPQRWRATYGRLMAAWGHADCHIVRFERLVAEVADVQREIVTFLGFEPDRPFEAYRENVPAGFKQTALNGLRQLDPSTTRGWAAPKHRERIIEMLKSLPELPDVLMAHGYEKDRTWVEHYR
jgi:hypothetical protein